MGLFMLITIGIKGFDKPLYIQIINIVMIALSVFNIFAGLALLCVRVTPDEEEQSNKCITTPKRRKRRNKDADSDNEFEAREQRYRR